MYTIIYKFNVITGKEEEFKKAWSKVTQAYLDHAGSLGSRLHHSESVNFIAYAQWPDKETFETAKDKLPLHVTQYGEQMRETCNDIEVLYKMQVILDMTKRA